MTDGVLKDLSVKPGFEKNRTAYTDQALFIDGDKVRFKDGYAQKIGGWKRVRTTSVATGVPRAIHTWADLVGQRLLAIGTNNMLALFKGGSDFQNITPAGFTSGPASNIMAFGWGSGAWGGDEDPIGSVVSGVDLGWGESPTSVSGGTSGLTQINLVQWSLDNYGEDLIANPRNGKIYRWSRSQGSEPASVIPGAPIQVNTVLISEPAPYLVAYGCCTQTGPFDPLLVRWSALENFSDWNASATNDAGDYRIQGGSLIVGALKTKRETLVFTDDVVYSQRYTGGDEIFTFERIGRNCGLISQHAAVEVNSIIYWMGTSSFFKYSGILEPLSTPLDKTLFDLARETSINFSQKEKVYVGINSEFSEIIWLYPSRDSLEIDRYVIYNYKENLWYDGTINRTVWTEGDIFELPIAANSSAVLYSHETGKNDDELPMKAWIKTGVFDIDDGDKMLFVDKFVPDMTVVGSVDLKLTGRRYSNGPDIVKGPYTISNSVEKISLRLRARQMQFSVSCSSLNGDFQFGTNRINIRPDGER